MSYEQQAHVFYQKIITMQEQRRLRAILRVGGVGTTLPETLRILLSLEQCFPKTFFG